MESRTEKRICDLCGVACAQKYCDSYKDGKNEYHLWECSACEVHAWLPLKNPGAEWYELDERYDHRNHNPILKPNKKHRDVLSYFKKSGRVLDIGCGVGNFLGYAHGQGWDVVGIDFDKFAVSAAKETFGLKKVYVSDLASFTETYKGDKFDLIVFFDVLEHIDNHDEFMNLVRELAAPNGHVAISVPYRHGWRWLMPHDLPPRHLTRWSAEALSRFLERYGFSVVRARRLPASFYYIVLKLRFRYGKWLSFGLMNRTKKSADVIGRGNVAKQSSKSVNVLHFLAKTKDVVVFGLPAAVIWLALFFTRRRYTDLYVIAKNKTSQ